MKKRKIMPVVAIAALLALGLGVTSLTSCSSTPDIPGSTTNPDISSVDPTPDVSSDDTTPGPNTDTTDSSSVVEEEKVGTVTVSTDGNGKVVASATKGKVGDIITLTVTPNEGYELDTLLANNVDVKASKQFSLIEGTNTVTATFKEVSTPDPTPDPDPDPVTKYTVTYTESSDYTVTGLEKDGYEEGATVTFSVTASEGKELVSVLKDEEALTQDSEGKYSFTMGKANVTLTINVKDVVYDLTLDVTMSKTTFTEGDGAELLTVAPHDSSLTLSSVEFDVSGIDGIGQLNEVPSDHPSAGICSKFFVATGVGSGTIKISATTSNNLTLTGNVKVTVNANYAAYTEISTAGQLIELLNRSGVVTDKYYLSTNIDLGGMVVNGRANGNGTGLTFSGVLDGKGYSITNFVVKNESTEYETGKATGLFWIFNGTLRNISLIGSIDSDGFSGLLAKEVNGGLIDNCYIEATQVKTADPDWTWGRDGVIASTIQGTAKVRNVVAKLNANNAKTFPWFAYSWDTTNVSVDNLYTNIAHDTVKENYTPFNPNDNPAVDKTKFTSLNHVDYDTATADSYNLDTSVWTLEDGKTPKLAHTGEDAVTLEPVVSATSSATSVTIGGEDITITGSIKYTSETPTWELEVVEGGDYIESTSNNDGTFSVKAKAAGSAKVKVKATIGDKSYYSEELSIVVLEAGDTEFIEVTPLAKGSSKTRFDGAGAYIWVKATSIGINSNEDFTALNDDKSNKISIAIEQKDAGGNAVARTLQGINLQDYNQTEDYLNIYSNYDGAPGSDWKTTITITIQGETKPYQIVASFTGDKYDDPNPSEEPEGPSTYTSITPLEQNTNENKTRIDGAGVWIWINTNDIQGLDGSSIGNLEKGDVTVEMKTGDGTAVNCTGNIDTFSDFDFTNKFMRVYVTLTVGPANDYTTSLSVKFVFNSLGYEIKASFTGTTYVVPTAE